MKDILLNKIIKVLLPCLAAVCAYAEPISSQQAQSEDERTVPEDTQSELREIQSMSKDSHILDILQQKNKSGSDTFYSQLAGIPYAGFLYFPEVTLTHGYDNNIYAERKKESTDWVTTISPTLVAKSNWAQHILNFGMGADIDSYLDHSTENVTDFWLSTGGQYDFSASSNVFGNLARSRKHEDRGSADAVPGLYPTQYYSTESNVGVAKKMGAVTMRFSADAEKLDFSTPEGAVSPYNNDDRSRAQYTAVARVGYAISPVLMPFIQGEGDIRRYDKSIDDYGFRRDSEGYRGALGMAFKPGDKDSLQGEAYIGQMQQKFIDDRFSRIGQFYYGTSMNWKPLADTTASTFLERTLGETTVANASSTMDSTVGGRVEKVLDENTLLYGSMSYTRSDFNGTARIDSIIDAAAGLKYYVTPTIFLGADYRFVNRDSNALFANYSRYQAMLSLGYAPGRKRASTDIDSSSSWLDYLDSNPDAEVHASITPKLIAYNNGNGFSKDNNTFLERYDYRSDTLSEKRVKDGLIADMDLTLVYGDPTRDFILLERDGFGFNNQRTRLKVDGETIRFKAYGTTFSSATGGIDYRYNPNAVVGGTDANYLISTSESTHVARFNFDSADTLYKVTRRNNGASVEFKPAAFKGNGAVAFNYDSYTRNGNQMTNYIIPNSALSGASKELEQWRGYSRTIDERSNRFAINVSFTPNDNNISLAHKNSFKLDYEFAIDKFQSSPSLALGDIAAQAGISLTGSVAGNPDIPYNFISDSTLISNSLRFNRPFGDSAIVAAGYSNGELKQDNFSVIQVNNGYTAGRNITDSGYLTGKFNITPTVGIEAFYRLNRRNNDSTYPAGDFINPVSTFSYPRMVMPRINRLDSQTYGLEAQFHPALLKTSWTLGLSHEDKERDLTYATLPAIVAQTSLYRDRSHSDEAFVRIVSRPAKGWTLRLTPSYLKANETGMVTEPGEMKQLKVLLSYAKPEWKEWLASVYYNYKDRINNQLGFSDYGMATALPLPYDPTLFGAKQYQNTHSTLRSAGMNFSLVPKEAFKVNFGYDWSQTDFSTYYFTTNRMRYHLPISGTTNDTVPLDFLLLDMSGYKVDTHSLSVGGELDKQKYVISGAYTLTHSIGDNATGLGGQSLPEVDARVNNLLHSLAFGVEYKVKSSLSVKGSYTYDNYNDMIYQSLSGEIHTLMVGMTYRN